MLSAICAAVRMLAWLASNKDWVMMTGIGTVLLRSMAAPWVAVLLVNSTCSTMTTRHCSHLHHRRGTLADVNMYITELKLPCQPESTSCLHCIIADEL